MVEDLCCETDGSVWIEDSLRAIAVLARGFLDPGGFDEDDAPLESGS